MLYSCSGLRAILFDLHLITFLIHSLLHKAYATFLFLNFVLFFFVSVSFLLQVIDTEINKPFQLLTFPYMFLFCLSPRKCIFLAFYKIYI